MPRKKKDIQVGILVNGEKKLIAPEGALGLLCPNFKTSVKYELEDTEKYLLEDCKLYEVTEDKKVLIAELPKNKKCCQMPKPIPYIITNPVNLDRHVQQMQSILTSLTWLERIYGQAYQQDRDWETLFVFR